MKKTFTTVFVLAMLIGLLINTACKKSQDAVAIELAVTLYNGVNGTPATGTYAYAGNETVEYNYTLQDGYTGLKVFLDGNEVANPGTVTMNTNHTIVVTAGQGTGEYRFSVIVSDGASGTPETGTYYYDAGEQIDYNYTINDGFTNLRVSFDGIAIGSTGTITISGDHALYVYTEKEYYIQGSWELTEAYGDGSLFTVTMTFSGETESGTVVDSDGGTGTYTVSGGSVYFIIEYPEVLYEYNGRFTNPENMKGDSKRFYVNEGTFNTGTWSAIIKAD